MYFPKCFLRKTWLDQCLKSCVSPDPSTDDMENGTQHYCNLEDNDFTLYIKHC